MFGYVECQAAFDWLCCLLANCPSAPSLSRRVHALKHDELGGLWHPWIVTAGLFNSVIVVFILPYPTHSIALFPTPYASPADRHMLIHGVPAEIRHAEHCMKNLPNDVHPPAWGAHLVRLWIFPQFRDTQAVESLITQSFPAHLTFSKMVWLRPDAVMTFLLRLFALFCLHY